MKHRVTVAACNPVRNGTAQIVGHRMTLTPSGDRPSDDPALFGGRMELYATDPRAGRIFSPGREFVLDLTTVDGRPLEPPAAEVPVAEAPAESDPPPADPAADATTPAPADPPAAA